MSNRNRLDRELVDRGLAATRSRARDMILAGHVLVDGAVAAKPGQAVPGTCAIEVSEYANPYVSRAGLKLDAAIRQFSPDLRGRTALDIGASTGGFTQVLLEHGAAKVYAVDVGHGQLDPLLRDDPRVINIEGLNARALTPDDVLDAVDVIVCDVSFISLKLALPPALGLAEPGAELFALIKPQFEAGRDGIGKGGIVRDEARRLETCRDIERWLETEMDWRVRGVVPSPITGSDGNAEYIVAARKA
ncbi:MAG: TlyA family RNA methyltransferase [Pseudomonadota bacterium]